MSTIVAESGAQLVARISSENRPTLENLCSDLFPDNGPPPGRIIEITGESGTGKSHFLMEIMARAILPTEYGGRGAHVIFFDLDCKFWIIRFLHILEKIACASNPDSDEKKTKEVIEKCLNGLFIFNCFSPGEYEEALHEMEELLTSDSSIALVTVGTIGAFYWVECTEEKPIKMTTYYKKALQRYRKVSNDYKVVVAFTRPDIFAPDVGKVPTTDADSPDYRIRLISHCTEEARGFEAETDARGQSYRTLFNIDNFGIKFLKL